MGKYVNVWTFIGVCTLFVAVMYGSMWMHPTRRAVPIDASPTVTSSAVSDTISPEASSSASINAPDAQEASLTDRVPDDQNKFLVAYAAARPVYPPDANSMMVAQINQKQEPQLCAVVMRHSSLHRWIAVIAHIYPDGSAEFIIGPNIFAQTQTYVGTPFYNKLITMHEKDAVRISGVMFPSTGGPSDCDGIMGDGIHFVAQDIEPDPLK